jgi:hypothetical protein
LNNNDDERHSKIEQEGWAQKIGCHRLDSLQVGAGSARAADVLRLLSRSIRPTSRPPTLLPVSFWNRTSCIKASEPDSHTHTTCATSNTLTLIAPEIPPSTPPHQNPTSWSIDTRTSRAIHVCDNCSPTCNSHKTAKGSGATGRRRQRGREAERSHSKQRTSWEMVYQPARQTHRRLPALL